MTKLDFHRFQVRHFSDHFEQPPCYCKMGQGQRAHLSVFGRTKFITRQNIQGLNANTLYVAAILFSRSSYIGSHYRASLIVLDLILTCMKLWYATSTFS